jgi:hypothetical protein
VPCLRGRKAEGSRLCALRVDSLASGHGETGEVPVSFGDLRVQMAEEIRICPGCEKQIKGMKVVTRWHSDIQNRDVEICQACTSLLFRMSRLYRIFGPEPKMMRSEP